jgi:hypothetical protein
MPTTGVLALASAFGPSDAAPNGTTESGVGETLPTWGTGTEALERGRPGVHKMVTIARRNNVAKARSAADHHARDLRGFLMIDHSNQEDLNSSKKKVITPS